MNIKEELRQRRVSFRVSLSDPNEIQFNCPFCLERRGEEDTAQCFHLNIKKEVGHCWHEHCDYRAREIEPVLERLFGLEEVIEEIEPSPVSLPDDFQLLTKIYEESDREARNYVLKRGITPEQIKKNHLGISYTGRYRYRIVFPITDPDGFTLYGITARDWTGKQKPKYLTNVGPKYLFNFNPNEEVCILSEGVFKALRIAQVTESCSASVLGHSLTSQQLEQIQKSRCRHIIIWPDPDGVGRIGATKIAEKLLDDWSGDVSLVWPIIQPADEAPLSDLSLSLTGIQTYSWRIRQELTQKRF